jgi:predicted acetyltransferase
MPTIQRTPQERRPQERTPQESRTRIDLLLEDGASASHLSVVDLSLHVGECVVTCGGIAGVGTDRAHRNKGYARQVLEDSLAFMREAGYHLSALFGITDFYPKFGFAPALTECTAETMTRYAERARPHYTVREFTLEDTPAVVAMYEALRGCETGPVARHPTTWTPFRRGTRWSDRVWAFVVEDAGRPVGYAAYDLDPWACSLAEVGYTAPDPALFDTIIARAAEIAWERRTDKITFYATPNDPFVRHLRRYGCEIKVTYPCCSGGMARVICQSDLVGTLEPLLAGRLRAALPGWEGSVVLSTDLGEDRLTVGAGRSEAVAEMPQGALAQLVLGYRAAGDLATQEGVRIDPAALPVFEALFPEGYPVIYGPDRF